MRKDDDNGFYGCPKCNCRIVYQLDLAKSPIGIFEKNSSGFYVSDLATDGSFITHAIFMCVDCGQKFDEPLWVSSECYEGL
jgi:hypothetical protein